MTAPEKQPAPPRPISPHLQIYRPQITSVLSILHRMTGLFLMVGIGVFILWIESIGAGKGAYDQFIAHGRSFLGLLLSFGIMISFFYHMGNGIRHLVWDFGHGFDLTTIRRSGWLVVIFSVCAALTLFGILLLD